MDIDFLRKDECQPLTTEQMTDIKSQFHPSNTANVNIVPYEIYDEDGEEIIVGEVRKTINGVKKSIPVYEKTIKFDDKNFSSGSDTNVSHEVSDIGESWLNRLIWRDNDGTSRPMIPYCDGNLNNRIVFRSITSTNIVFRTNGDSWSSSDYDYVKVTIRYTKTTDEWQPV